MKKRLLLLTLTLVMFVGLMLVFSLPASAATAPTNMRIEPSDTNGIPAQIYVFKASVQTGGPSWNPTYSDVYQIYLPGNADAENCFLSWDGDATVTVNGISYTSGKCPIPSPCDLSQTTSAATTTTYTFKDGNTTLASLQFITYKGSESVTPVFIVIDESDGKPTIAEMDGDPDHEVTCSGTIYIDGDEYIMKKIKGRGNATWKQARDKKPYNITLKDDINFPGVESAPTDKWSFLAEILDPSLLGNRVGFYLAHELGIGQDTASADVWMNGEYQGCYTVTPKTDSFVSKNGYMIEEDNYLEGIENGGDPQFALDGLKESQGWSSCYNRITVKKIGKNLLKNDAGEVDESDANLNAVSLGTIKPYLQEALYAIRSVDGYYSETGKHYTDYINIESFAKMYLMHEYVKSYDLCAGSLLFHRDGNTDADKLIAGPLWDLDNAMGSTYQNSSLGKADNRSTGDRRRGDGDFIPLYDNEQRYKTSLYKLLGEHDDFMQEVYRQYNMHKSFFDDLPETVESMTEEIAASAKMNFMKVEKIVAVQGYSNTDNHKYSQQTPFGSAPYQQTYLIANDPKTHWDNYATNLHTYVTTRSLWFANNYYAADIVCDDGASVTVYKTRSVAGEHEDDADIANPRNSNTGELDYSGNGEINFVVNVKPGYVMQSVTTDPATGSYTSMTGPDATTGLYRITGVKGAFTINVTTTAIEYPITFVDEDGATVLQSSNVAYGETPVYSGETPTKASDDNFTYTFAGWTPEIVAVSGPATYTATYSAAEIGYTVNLNDLTNGKADISVIFDGGSYSGAVTFNVTCANACAVLCSSDEGETYERLPATQKEDGYNFTVDVKDDMIISVIMVGDVTGDGKINTTDVTQIKRYIAGNRSFDLVQLTAAEVTGEGKINTTDVTQIKRFIAGKRPFTW